VFADRFGVTGKSWPITRPRAELLHDNGFEVIEQAGQLDRAGKS
jgi:hypothetical protein